MIRFLVVIFLFKLNEIVKNKDPSQKKTQTKEKQKTQNQFSFSLFRFVVLLLIDVGVIVIILLLCSKKWLVSYVPICHENLENKCTTNPPNGTITKLPTRLFYIEMELEPFFPISWNPPTITFFFLYLCLSLFV